MLEHFSKFFPIIHAVKNSCGNYVTHKGITALYRHVDRKEMIAISKFGLLI